jgi:hypothetical protein
MLQNCSRSHNRPLCVRGGGGILTLLFALSLVCAALAFTGCDHNSKSSGVLTGKWISIVVSDGTEYITKITITGGTVEYSDSYGGSRKSDIAVLPDFEASYGVIIVKFTEYTGDTSYVDKYGAMYWKELHQNSVYLAEAYSQTEPYTQTAFDTLEAAKANFTNNNAGKYVNWSYTSPYSK